MTPQRRVSDRRDIAWWLKWLAGIVGSLVVILGALHVLGVFAYGQAVAPIMHKLDALAMRDSVRADREKYERIAGDSEVSGKLDIVISLLKKRSR